MKRSLVILAMVLVLPAAVFAYRGGESGGSSGGSYGGGDRGGNAWSGGNNGGNDGGRDSGSWSDSRTNDNSKADSTGTRATVSNGTRSSSTTTNSTRGYSNNLRTNGLFGRNPYYRTNRAGVNNSTRSGNGFNPSSQGIHHFKTAAELQRGTLNRSASTASLNRSSFSRTPKVLTGKAMLPSKLQHSAPGLPTKGPAGKSAALVSPGRMNMTSVKSQMASVAGSKAFLDRAAILNKTEIGKNQYYWHTWNGNNYCHYYDRYGCNWYGWYCGNWFFWTQFYDGNWWWYDPWFDHYCYWWGGGWWWQDPMTTTVYAYNDGDYDPAGSNSEGNNGNYNAPSPSPQDLSPKPVKGEDDSVDFVSKDGGLKVKVTSKGDAFLSGREISTKPIYLDSDVADVKFSKSDNGTSRILLIYKDGSFKIFNSDGTPPDGSKT